MNSKFTFLLPLASASSAFHDAPDASAVWKVATPNDAASRGEWWMLFADPALNFPAGLAYVR